MITRCLCALVALAVGLSPVVDARLGAAAAGAAGAAPSKWTRLRTPNFTLLGEHGDKPLRRVAERMDSSARSSAASSRAPARGAGPIIVHVFGSERTYRPFMPLFNGKRVDVGGYFQRPAAPTTSRCPPRPASAPTRQSSTSTSHLLVGQHAGRRAGVVQRGAGGVLQHLPDVRRPRGLARPRQGGARLRAPRALHPAQGAARRRSSIAPLQRGRSARRVLCRVVGAGALPADGQPAAQGPGRHLPQQYADGVPRPPRSARPSAPAKPSSRRSCGDT